MLPKTWVSLLTNPKSFLFNVTATFPAGKTIGGF